MNKARVVTYLKDLSVFASRFVFIVFVYYCAAALGLKFATLNNAVSPVWPATGVAISLIFFIGTKYVFAIFVGAFLANFLAGSHASAASLIALGNMLEAYCAVMLLQRFRLAFVLPSEIYTRILKYLSVALGPTTLSATIGTLALYLDQTIDLHSVASNWITWWIGDSLGFLLVFPLLQEIFVKPNTLDKSGIDTEKKWLQPKEVIKLFPAFLFVVSFTHFVFAMPTGYPFLFVIFFSLLLVAFLAAPWTVYLAAIYISALSIYQTNQGVGPFWSGVRNDSLIHLEFFLASVWITAIVLCSLIKTNTLKRPAWALGIGWLLTGATFFAFYQSNIHESRIYYEGKAREAKSVVEETMNGYVRLMEAGVGLLKVDPVMTAQKWKDYTDNLRLLEKYPGLKGFGIIYKVPEQGRSSFLQKMRSFYPNFTITSVQDAMDKDHPGSFVISHLEPLEVNRAALGLDISSEKKRRAALVRARDSGEAALTEPIQLMQSAKIQEGYLLLMPFYVGGIRPTTVEERRNKIAGFVYAPLEASAFFDAATKVYASELKWVSSEKWPSDSSDIFYTELDLVDIKQSIGWHRSWPGAKVLSNVEASLAGFTGAFVTVVLAILVAGLENISYQAQRIADEKTHEVEERERLWKTLAEVSPIGIFGTSADGYIHYANHRWMSIFNMNPRKVPSSYWHGPIHAQDRERVTKTWEDFKSQGGEEYKCTYRINNEFGVKYLSTNIVEMNSEKGVVTGYLGTVQDVTDLHQNQLALATASRLSSLGQMAGGIAHEINTPLSVISVNAELLKTQLKSESIDISKLQQGLEKIQSTVHRIARIIKGLRSLSRDSSDASLINFPIAKAIEDTVELCEKRFMQNNIPLILPEKNRTDLIIEGHPDQVIQVLLNLLNNAFDVVSQLKEKWVKISYETPTPRLLRLIVQDSGDGISPEVSEHLFNPFFTTKEVGQGTGLGLSISRSLMEKMGGKLYLDSSREHTTFVVEFNLVPVKPLAAVGRVEE